MFVPIHGVPRLPSQGIDSKLPEALYRISDTENRWMDIIVLLVLDGADVLSCHVISVLNTAADRVI